MGKLSYFLMAATAALTVGATWYLNRRQEEDKTQDQHDEEIIEIKESDVDSGLPRKVADVLHGGSFHDDTISEDLIRQKKIKQKAVEIARQELKDNPMAALSDARELLGTIQAPHPAVYFNAVDDDAEEPAEADINMPELLGLVPGEGPGFAFLNSDEFLDSIPPELQEQMLAQQMAFFQQGVPLFN